MTAFFNRPVWITLAMVIPGQVAMTTLFGVMVAGKPWPALPGAFAAKDFSDRRQNG